MPVPARSIRALALLAPLLLAACGDSPPAPGPTPGPTPGTAPGTAPATEDLPGLLRRVLAVQNGSDKAAATATLRGLLPTQAELRQVLRPGPAADAFVAAFGGTQEKSPPVGAQLAPPERSEVTVHRATTEELAAYVRDTVAFAEFPGGMRRFAQELALPGLTWCAVELREPGKESGTRLTAFVQAGGRWVLVPKPWTALPREEEAPPR